MSPDRRWDREPDTEKPPAGSWIRRGAFRYAVQPDAVAAWLKQRAICTAVRSRYGDRLPMPGWKVYWG
jgi:hypothetical protein